MSDSWQAYRKTFVSGEYAACQFGRGFVLTYGPAFMLTPSDQMKLSTFGLSVLKNYPEIHTSLALRDTIVNHGGVGASSAELACLYQYLCDTNLEQSTDLTTKRQWYLNHAWDGHGLPPSGIDFIAQQYQGLMWVDCNKNICEHIEWPFQEYVWLVIKTNDKLNTHTHLRAIPNSLDLETLDKSLNPIKDALEQKDFSQFVDAQQQYDQALETFGFTTEKHKPYKDAINTLPNVAYIRGSGALGQDTWLILVEKSNVQKTFHAINDIFPIKTHYQINLDHYDTN